MLQGYRKLPLGKMGGEMVHKERNGLNSALPGPFDRVGNM